MTVDRNRLFEQLDPPPGGVERFRARLDEPGSGANDRSKPLGGWMPALGARRSPWITAAGAAAALALVIAVVTRLPFGSAPADRPDPGTTMAGAAAPASHPAPAGSLADAPELDWLLGRTSARSEVSVTVRGEEAEVIEVPSSDPRIRVYMVASRGGD